MWGVMCLIGVSFLFAVSRFGTACANEFDFVIFNVLCVIIILYYVVNYFLLFFKMFCWNKCVWWCFLVIFTTALIFGSNCSRSGMTRSLFYFL